MEGQAAGEETSRSRSGSERGEVTNLHDLVATGTVLEVRPRLGVREWPGDTEEIIIDGRPHPSEPELIAELVAEIVDNVGRLFGDVPTADQQQVGSGKSDGGIATLEAGSEASHPITGGNGPSEPSESDGSSECADASRVAISHPAVASPGAVDSSEEAADDGCEQRDDIMARVTDVGSTAATVTRVAGTGAESGAIHEAALAPPLPQQLETGDGEEDTETDVQEDVAGNGRERHDLHGVSDGCTATTDPVPGVGNGRELSLATPTPVPCAVVPGSEDEATAAADESTTGTGHEEGTAASTSAPLPPAGTAPGPSEQHTENEVEPHQILKRAVTPEGQTKNTTRRAVTPEGQTKNTTRLPDMANATENRSKPSPSSDVDVPSVGTGAPEAADVSAPGHQRTGADDRDPAPLPAGFTPLRWTVLVALGCLMAIGAWSYATPDAADVAFTCGGQNAYSRSSAASFRQHVEQMESSEFPMQTSLTWKSIVGRGRHHLCDVERQRPAVFLLAARGSVGGKRTLQCLARRLAAAFTNGDGDSVGVLGASDAVAERGVDVEEKVYRKVNGILHRDHSTTARLPAPPVLIIEHIEDLPYPVPLLFFSYCDSSHTEHPQAVLIFTLSVPADFSPLAAKLDEGMVVEYMSSVLWTEDLHPEYRQGTVDALVTRISDVTLVIESEENSGQLENCQLPP